jgi:hypothetical protein
MYERVRFLHNKVTTILDLDKIPESTQWPARHEKGYVKFYDPNYDETEIPQPSSEYPSSLSHHNTQLLRLLMQNVLSVVSLV